MGHFHQVYSGFLTHLGQFPNLVVLFQDLTFGTLKTRQKKSSNFLEVARLGSPAIRPKRKRARIINGSRSSGPGLLFGRLSTDL